jgi:hexulose-6-phosphate isomerase
METSLRNAALWGADAVLLVPAVVDRDDVVPRRVDRSQRVIRERLLPLAQRAEGDRSRSRRSGTSSS